MLLLLVMTMAGRMVVVMDGRPQLPAPCTLAPTKKNCAPAWKRGACLAEVVVAGLRQACRRVDGRAVACVPCSRQAGIGSRVQGRGS